MHLPVTFLKCPVVLHDKQILSVLQDLQPGNVILQKTQLLSDAFLTHP